MKKTLIALMIASLAGFTVFGQDTAKEDLKKSGQDVKKGRQSHRTRRETCGQGCGKRNKEGCP